MLNGLVRKFMAPARIAFTAAATVPNPVRITTGTGGVRSLAHCRTWNPSARGMRRLVMHSW